MQKSAKQPVSNRGAYTAVIEFCVTKGEAPLGWEWQGGQGLTGVPVFTVTPAS